MTHDDLVRRASRWLQTNKHCSVVASELNTGNLETPDVLGFWGWGSTLIEAKISIADFRADQKKTFRLNGRGMGRTRYYIIPSEMKENIYPLMPEGWGLLLCKGNRITVERKSNVFENDQNAEILFLLSVVRRIAGRSEPLVGVRVKCYTIDMSFFERERLIRECERKGIPVDEKEIDEKLEPRAELFIEPDKTALSLRRQIG